MVGRALQVMVPLEQGDVLSQIPFADAAEESQEVAEPGPQPLLGIAMHLPHTIAVEIHGPSAFGSGVIHCPMDPLAVSCDGTIPFHSSV